MLNELRKEFRSITTPFLLRDSSMLMVLVKEKLFFKMTLNMENKL